MTKRIISNRIFYLLVIMTLILLGLASRKYTSLLPTFLADNAGDVLWAMMVYFGCRFLFLKHSLLSAVLISILFSFGIEFSQLYQADWILHLCQTTIGALILGKGFLAVDLIRYLTGISIAYLLDRLTIGNRLTLQP